MGLNNQLFPNLFRQRAPWDVQQRTLQYVQEGVRRPFTMDAFNTFPRFNWPDLLKLLICVDTNFVEPVFGLQFILLFDLKQVVDSYEFLF
jgi:hypothetical protein